MENIEYGKGGFSDENIPDVSKNIGSSIKYQFISTICSSLIAIGVVYSIIDYRISKTDNSIDKLLDKLNESGFSDIDKKISVSVEKVLDKKFSALDIKIAELEKTISNRVEKVENRVDIIEKKVETIKLEEILELKRSIEEKLKEIDRLTKNAENKFSKDMKDVLKSDTFTEDSSSQSSETSDRVKDIVEDKSYNLPFTLKKIISDNMVEIRIYGQSYMIDPKVHVIMDRYEIDKINEQKRYILVYDKKEDKYIKLGLE